LILEVSRCHHWIPWPWKCGKWHTTCYICTVTGQVMANPNAYGGHIGFLPVKKLAQG